MRESRKLILNRRGFLSRAASALGGAVVARRAGAMELLYDASIAPLSDAEWKRTWDAAVAVLAGNLRKTPYYPDALLFEGSTYRGIWQECGPHEALVYAQLRQHLPQPGAITPLQAARNNHMAFFALQREDGQLPAAVKTGGVGFGQIQMVVPIAATAWELAQMTGDEELLHRAYEACSRWDAWLRRYRDTRKTGLVEGFCTYDTGHDHSPRWKGIPNQCPDADARKCPRAPGMPRLCPDLSATAYGGRVALAAMAHALGKREEAARWREDAETIRRLIVEKLYAPDAAAFYDLDSEGKFVRVRSDVMSRVMGEHVLDRERKGDREIFDAVWRRQLHNPAAFWAPYPLTSIARNDPQFVRPIPRNSWGGASQALTALRAPRWMPHYGKSAELAVMMRAWCSALARDGRFCQQMDPLTGVFTQPDPGGYSPAALVFLLFSTRLGFGLRSPRPTKDDSVAG